MKYFDTEQEAAINAGVSWPYEKLGPYELLLADDFKAKGLSVGDTVTLKIKLSSPFNIFAVQYNELAPEMGWKQVPYFSSYDFALETEIDYTIKDFLTKTYGKLPDNDAKTQLMMEYEYWVPAWANHTDFSDWLDEETETHFKEYLNSPGISYQYSNMILANLPSPRYSAYEHNNFDSI